MKRLQLFSLLFLLFISSCTIQKRLFRPGYSVEWNSKYKENKQAETSSKLLNTVLTEESIEKVNALSENKTISEAKTNIEMLKTENSKPNRTLEKAQLVPRNKVFKIVSKQKTKKTIQLGKHAKNIEKEYTPQSGVTSLAFSFVSILGWILFISNPITFTFWIIIGFGILGIIFGGISINSFKKNRDKYLHKWPGILGFWLSFISTFLFITIIVLAIAALSNWGG